MTSHAEIVDQIPHVEGFARQYASRLPRHIHVEDLIAAGLLGLVQAARRSNGRPDWGGAFARHRVRGAMVDHVRWRDPLGKDLLDKIRTATDERGRVTDERLRFIRYRTKLQSLDSNRLGRVYPGEDGEASPLVERIAGDLPAPTEVTLAHETRQILLGAIQSLPPVHRRVVELYYLDNARLKDVGEAIGKTEARVCQLKGDAIKRLRKILEARGIKREDLT